MNLKQYRDHKKWSQQQLADWLSDVLGKKIYQSHVQAWEGETFPNVKTASAITKASNGKIKW